jgi:hypothetical protein
VSWSFLVLDARDVSTVHEMCSICSMSCLECLD